MKFKSFFVVLLILLALGHPVRADIRLPRVISNRMVLQQQRKVTLWGWADPGEQVTVKADWNTKLISRDYFLPAGICIACLTAPNKAIPRL